MSSEILVSRGLSTFGPGKGKPIELLKEISFSPDLITFKEDGRAPIEVLYHSYYELVRKYGFTVEIVFNQVTQIPNNENVFLPILCFKSPKKGPAFWLISGIHGEEPAGPNKIAEEINNLGRLGQQIPMVIMPLCNPKAYTMDWRYWNEHRNWHVGKSVGAAEHLLPEIWPRRDGTIRPCKMEASCAAAECLCETILRVSKDYPIVLWIDDHEDEDIRKIRRLSHKHLEASQPYIYSAGMLGENDPVAREIVNLLHGNGRHVLHYNGRTRFNEKIEDGVVADPFDYSLEHLVVSNLVWSLLKGEFVNKDFATTAIVVESQVSGFSLEERLQLRDRIYYDFDLFFLMALEAREELKHGKTLYP